MRMMITFLAALISLGILFVQPAVAAEQGYDEAMKYFIFRDKNKKVEVEAGGAPGGIDSPDNIILDPSKYFISLGAGEIFGFDHYSAELGMTFLQTRYFQQSLHLEYLQFNTRSSDEYKAGSIANTYGQGLFLLHNVQLSSQFFYLGPELSVGVGRIFDSPRKGSLLTLKAGLVYSNKWSQRMLFSAHLYYRRSQYFKKDYHGDGVGLSLRFGF
ncbi:MAG: hypothetical protein ACRBBP_05230 [Bdellovibrionales bacterium]